MKVLINQACKGCVEKLFVVLVAPKTAADLAQRNCNSIRDNKPKTDCCNSHVNVKVFHSPAASQSIYRIVAGCGNGFETWKGFFRTHPSVCEGNVGVAFRGRSV